MWPDAPQLYRYLESGRKKLRPLGIHLANEAPILFRLCEGRRSLFLIFSMFPDGWPGAGLLLLRLAAAAVLIIQGAAYLGTKHELGFIVLAVVLGAVGFLLLIGFLSRFVALVAALAGVSTVFSWLPATSIGPLEIPMTAMLSAVIAVSVICMGPGAISLDAHLFGRREIIIPASSSKDSTGVSASTL